MLPLYFTAAGVSWLMSGDFGAWNVFERGAGPRRRQLRRPPAPAGAQAP